MKLLLLGSTGDLAKAKIMPALNALGIIPVSYGRKDIIDTNYIKGELDEIHTKLADQAITHAYVALPPAYFEQVLRELALLQYSVRIALEKPFGTSLLEALRLMAVINELGIADRVYLVDHYIAKPAVIDLMNNKVEAQNITRISLDAFESNTVATRGAFYDAVGTIKDFVQNHVLVMLGALLAGESKRERVIEKLEYIPESLMIGQYAGYLETPGVAEGSQTETYVSCEFLYNDSIPVRVRAGKALDAARTSIHITYESGEEKEINIQSPVNSYEAILKDFISDSWLYRISYDEVMNNWRLAEVLINAKAKARMITYPQGVSAELIQ